ncbi:MAG: metallophosphoesterase [Candidatus Enterosoma sp.]|nr:metallophosphoesterase [Candidatus Enterosoma sp.]
MPENKKNMLALVIKKAVKRKVCFDELLPSEKKVVLNYISDKQLDVRVLDNRWFDVLSQKFCVVESVLSEEDDFGIGKVKREFDTFSDFYKFVKGCIYENGCFRSCFYGYQFSKQEIDDYDIKIDSLNFDSFISENVDSYTFDSLRSANKQEIDFTRYKAKAMAEQVSKIKKVTTLNELETEYRIFKARFKEFPSGRIFFSFLLKKEQPGLKDAVIDFACKHDTYDGFTFFDVLLRYGKEAALHVIDNFDAPCSYPTYLKRVRSFKEVLEKYDAGLCLRRESGFSECCQLYYVRDRYHDTRFYQLDHNEYFMSFDEFVSFLKGDLSGSDLTNAPVSKADVKKFKIDEFTKLPLSKEYKIYEVSKIFDGEKFVVTQKWIDSDGDVVLLKKHSFSLFFDFVHFLKGDLSNANLVMCDGIENISGIKNLNLDGIMIRSDSATKLGLPFKHLSLRLTECKEFDTSRRHELETMDELLMDRADDSDYSDAVSYISDIHLLHRMAAYHCQSPEDADYVIKTIAMTLGKQATKVNLIAGDTSSDFSIFKFFVKSLNHYSNKNDFFFILGNHELWPFAGESLNSITSRYKQFLKENGFGRMHLVQNNLFYLEGTWKEVPEEELSAISLDDLKKKTRGARMIIFGGIGFAGMNETFNADNGIYMNVLSRADENKESSKFLALYEKVTMALADKNLIILSHMPMKDWGGKDIKAKEGIVYVNGHSHWNYFFDDGKKRIYADNQVGYKGKRLSFKKFFVNSDYDWFAGYEDGIYEISKDDYEIFYRGIGEMVTLNRRFDKLFMIKRSGTYMFLMQSPKGRLSVLNGGSIKSVGGHSLEYFYENLTNYAQSVTMFLSKYDLFEKEVSNGIRKLGGLGRVHGSIIDIDFYNHLYLNPLDSSVTPYFAYSMTRKYVYKNLPSLLNSRCPRLYENYEKLIRQSGNGAELVALNNDLVISKDVLFVESTEMYKISRILKGLQFTSKHNIVRLWNDALIKKASEENGRMIVSGIINPESVPQVIEKSQNKKRT